jgi:hypothetical protein
VLVLGGVAVDAIPVESTEKMDKPLEYPYNVLEFAPKTRYVAPLKLVFERAVSSS